MTHVGGDVVWQWVDVGRKHDLPMRRRGVSIVLDGEARKKRTALGSHVAGDRISGTKSTNELDGCDGWAATGGPGQVGLRRLREVIRRSSYP